MHGFSFPTRWPLRTIWPGALAILALVAAGLSITGRDAPSQRHAPQAVAAAGPAQATPVPPFATCPLPAPGSTASPPGLYPFVRVGDVVIHQEELPGGCPTTRMLLRICIRNGGPAPMGAFRVRVQGCGIGAAEFTVDEVDMFNETCIDLPDAQIPPGDCAIMLDAACTARCCFDRYWTGPVLHPQPRPTCSATATAGTPTVAATATPTANGTPGATASVWASRTPTGRWAVLLPWARVGP